MSALAARRAAAAAAAAGATVATVATTSQPSSTSSRTLFSSSAPSIKTKNHNTATLDISESEVESDIDSPDPGPSKRRRRSESPKPRYFVASDAVGKPSTSKRKFRKFSPSAPVSELDGSSDSSSSSDGDGDGDGDGDDEDVRATAAAEEVDEGRAIWSVPAEQSSMISFPTSSPFLPREGVNFHRFTKEDLQHVDGEGPGVIIALGMQESLTLAGVFTLTPLSQGVSVFSSVLVTGIHRIFAPTSHPLPVLTAVSGEIKPIDLKLPSTFSREGCSIFLLRERRGGIQGLSVPGFTNIWPQESPWGIQGLVPSSIHPHLTPPTWISALESIKEGVVLVKGPKRSGKSTFARACLNKLLEAHDRVAWLETDLGQGEFGCGGVVGLWILDKPLLGPPFTHPMNPTRAMYLGDLSPQSCPDEYLAAVQQVINYYRFEMGDIPLVVNTQGWVKGLGEDLLRSIETMVEPTHIFGFKDPSGESYNEPEPGLQILTPVESPLQARYTAADHRMISMISYFHSRGEGGWDFSVPLLAMPPWQVELGTTIKRVYLVGEGADAVLEEDLSLALNGSIVALVERDMGLALDLDLESNGVGGESEKVYQQGSLPSYDDSSSNFLGLAIIRAVSGNRIHLITPLASEVLVKTTMIVKNGALELPMVGMLDWEARWEDLPFVEVGGEGVGADKRRFRRNLQRKGL